MENRNNIIKFKKPFKFQIGYIVFIVLAVYLLILTVNFALQKRVASYEVTTGSLSSYYYLTGFACRNETVVYSSNSGYISYFAEEASKVSAKSLCYSLSQTELSADQTIDDEVIEKVFNKDKKEELTDILKTYSYDYDDQDFYSLYSLKNSLNTAILTDIADKNNKDTISKNMSAYYAFVPGIILYRIDGLEDVTTDNFTYGEINKQNYNLNDLSNNSYINSGEAVYKVITDENWYIISEIDDECFGKLKEYEGYVDVTILRDDYNCSLPYTLTSKEGRNYIILELNSGVIRYAKERFIDIELLLDSTTGYKIPNSSITYQTFIKIPSDYATKGGSSNSDGFLKAYKDEDGSEVISFKRFNLMIEGGGYFYVRSDDLSPGDSIVLPETGEKITLNETEQFPCVYSINKGYAALRVIEVILNNEDYSIIKINTSYGVSNYDHIVLDAKQVREGEMIR